MCLIPSVTKNVDCFSISTYELMKHNGHLQPHQLTPVKYPLIMILHTNRPTTTKVHANPLMSTKAHTNRPTTTKVHTNRPTTTKVHTNRPMITKVHTNPPTITIAVSIPLSNTTLERAPHIQRILADPPRLKSKET